MANQCGLYFHTLTSINTTLDLHAMERISPYLFFDGNCQEAMNFYRECLGGELNVIKVSDTEASSDFPQTMANRIMHARLTTNNTEILASDSLNGEGLDSGSNIVLTCTCRDESELNEIFKKLSHEGTATVPPEKPFWGGHYGRLVDKFGFRWMLISQS